MLAQPLQALPQPDVRPGPAVRHRVALVGGVLEAKLDRGQCQARGRQSSMVDSTANIVWGPAGGAVRAGGRVLVTTVYPRILRLGKR